MAQITHYHSMTRKMVYWLGYLIGKMLLITGDCQSIRGGPITTTDIKRRSPHISMLERVLYKSFGNKRINWRQKKSMNNFTQINGTNECIWQCEYYSDIMMALVGLFQWPISKQGHKS